MLVFLVCVFLKMFAVSVCCLASYFLLHLFYLSHKAETFFGLLAKNRQEEQDLLVRLRSLADSYDFHSMSKIRSVNKVHGKAFLSVLDTGSSGSTQKMI